MHPRNLTWVMLREYVETGKPIVLPIGSVESHGAHLPINTDTLIAEHIADMLARELGLISLPPATYSIAVPVRPGNVHIPFEVFKAYFEAVVEHFVTFGFKKFIVLLGHGGPDMKGAIYEAGCKLCGEKGVSMACFHISKVLHDLGLVDTRVDKHAGLWETSIVLAIDESLVGDVTVYKSKDDLKRYGVAGDPTRANKELGHTLIKGVVEYIKEFVKSFRFDKCYFNWET